MNHQSLLRKTYFEFFVGGILIAAVLIFLVLSIETLFPGRFVEELSPTGAHLVLSDEAERYPVGLYLQYLKDETQTMTIEQVASAQMESHWQQSVAPVPSFGFTDSAVWLRLEVENRARRNQAWELEVAHPYLDEILFYGPYIPGKEQPQMTSGENPGGPSAMRPRFPLEVEQGTTAVYFMRLTSQASVRAPLIVWSAEALELRSLWMSFLWGSVLGIFLFSACYRIIQFIVQKEPSYLFIAIYSFSVAVVYVVPGIFPLLRDVIGIENSWRLGILFGVIYWISLLLFIDSFMELKKIKPGLHKAIRICILLLLPLLPVAIFAGLRFNLILTYLVSVPLSVFILYMGVRAIKLHRNAGYLVIASAIPFAVVIVQSVLRLGAGRSDVRLDWLPITGNVLMLILFSLAQSDRILQLQGELNAANRALQENEQELFQYLQAIPLGVSVYDTNMRLRYVNPAVEMLSHSDTKPPFDTYEIMNKPFEFIRAGSGEPYPADELPIIRAVKGGAGVSVDDLVLIDGERRVHLQVWSSPILDANGKLSSVVNIFADITERRGIEAEVARINSEHKARLQELVDERTCQEQRQRKIAESMQHSATALSSNQALTGVLNEIMDRLGDVLPYSSAAIFVNEGDHLVATAGKGPRGLESEQKVAISDPSHAVVQVFTNRCPLVLPKKETVEDDEAAGGSVCLPCWIGVPLLTAGEPVGVLVVEDPAGEPDSNQALVTLEAFASHAAIAVTNARLLRQAGEVAAAEERNRLARDLHDAVTQTLFSVSLIAEALPALWKVDPAAVMPYLQKMNRLSRSALAEMRTLLLELRPSALIDTPIEQLLTNLKDAFSGRIVVSLQINSRNPCSYDLPGDVKIAFYRIAQEALNNISKHANTQNAQIRFTYESCGAVLVIRDDGRGFNPQQPDGGGIGLKAMIERAKAIGADVEITSQPGMGATISLTWEQR